MQCQPTAPVNDSISASVSNCRKMREPSAPIAERTANSCCRAVPRANSRIETFPQPISSNKATAASSRYNVPPISVYEVVIQSFYGHAEMLREMRRSLLRELLEERLKLRVRRRARDSWLEPNHREISAHRIGP